MAGETTPSLFVTANVGSIFEDPTSMLKTWTEEFLATVVRLDPKFVALHCQEVGGKKYEASMKHVEDFVKLLLSSEELRLFDRAEIYLDEDFSSTESFTALGNFYLIHESVREALVFDFESECFVPVVGRNIHSGNIEQVTTKEKSKFPHELFPECKWARKGFMRTRWKLNGTVFDLINIHLFHDASNFVAMETFPSIYCQNRQRALEHTLKRFHTDRYGGVPYIVFGDFNFRTDTQGVVKKLSEGLKAVRVHSNKCTEHTKLQYTDDSSQVIFTLGKKEFSHSDHQKMFTENVGEWLKELDREYEPFSEELYEFAISFPPTYPYVEDNNGGECYMQTRCPSWCDRVFLSCSAKSLVNNIQEESSVEYGLIGKNSCMGDHKPVFLRADIKGGQGTVICTPLLATSDLSLAAPCLYAINRLPPSPPSSPPLARFSTIPVQQDGLTVPPFQHHNSPYTPDSTDTEPDSLPASAEIIVSPQELASSLELAAERRKSAPTPMAMRPLRRNSSMRRSGSKIPVRDSNPPTTTSPIPVIPQPSRIPVSKSKRKSDVTGKSTSTRFLKKDVEEVMVPRLVLKVEPPCSDEECRDSESAGESPLGEISFIDSLTPTQWIQGSESDSVTDSGFSVSPALSGAMSPTVDTEKSCTAMDPKNESEDPIETTPPPVLVERFSLVRRIQSASSMERKSSFPPALPGSSSPDAKNGMRTYRCFSDSNCRPVALAHTQSRMRLISSNSNIDQTVPRLQSHHSSSEEEWFEQVCEEDERRQKRLSTHKEDDTWASDDVHKTDKVWEAPLPDDEVDRELVPSDDKSSRKKSKCKGCCTVM